MHSENITSLTLEVENIIGNPLLPVSIDKRIAWVPIVVAVLILLTRPKTIYDEDGDVQTFNVYKFLVKSTILSILVMGLFIAYSYRRFF